MSVMKRLAHSGMTMSQMRRRANQKRSDSARRGFVSVSVTSDIARINRVLNQLPQTMQFAAYDRALPAAGKVVQQRAKELAPKSSQNPKGGAEKWSKKSKQDWSSIPLSDLIIIKVLRKSRTYDPTVLIGPKFKEGNKANFVAPMEENIKQHVQWGKRAGILRKENDFLKRAADETKPQQVRAFLSALIPDVRKRLKSLGR